VPIRGELRVILAGRFEDARVRLVDGSTRLVPAAEVVSVDARTEFRIAPEALLRPGTEYRLVIEPDASEPLHDSRGNSYLPTELSFRTAGDPPPRPKAKKHRRRR